MEMKNEGNETSIDLKISDIEMKNWKIQNERDNKIICMKMNDKRKDFLMITMKRMH